MSLKIFLPLFLLFFVTVCTPPVKKEFEAFSGKLDQYFSKQFPAGQPGCAVLIMKGENTVFAGGYGLADMETKDPITTKTLFNLGSISKTFVAHGILILHEQGKLSVEDPLEKYFSFKDPVFGNKVKIKHLLTHTSGLPDVRTTRKDSVFYLTAKDEENWAPILQADHLNFEPGSEFEYSNPAFNALALIIEKTSGQV
jgi:CubicO group peptidase (beta-lactamase class C family)